MTFLAPLLLLAAAALAVPLVVHRVRREDSTVRSFPALRYLARTVEEQEQTSRFEELLLLLLRLAAIAFLVLAAARLVLPLGPGDHPPGAVVIVVDNGVHSSAVVGERRVLDALVELGRQAMAELGPLDRVWVVAGGEPWKPTIPGTPAAALDALEALEPTGVATNIPELIRRARAILSPVTDAPRHVLVLSTLAPGTLADPSGDPGFGAAGANAPPVLLHGPGPDRPPNRGIATVRVGGGLAPRAGRESTLEVHLAGDATADVAVRAHVDGELVAAGRTDVAGRVELPLAPAEAGWLTGRVEIDPDALRMDDRRAFVVEVRPAPVVGIVGEPHPYLAEAIGTLAGAGRIELRDPREGPVDLVLHVEGSPGGGDDAYPDPVRDESASTGPVRVVVPPADPTRIPTANRLLEGWGVGWRFEPGDPEGTSPLEPSSSQPGSLAGLTVSTAVHPAPAAERSSGVVVERADGHAWLVRTTGSRSGIGTVILVGSPLDPEHSELPTSAAMIPFLDRLLASTGSGDPGPGTGEIVAGRPLVADSAATVLRTPDGIEITVDGGQRWTGTGLPGLYELLGADEDRIRPVAVHIPSSAVTGSETPGRAEAAARLAPDVEAADDDGRWARALLAERRGRELSGLLGVLALLLLAIESWVASRIDGRVGPSHSTAEIR